MGNNKILATIAIALTAMLFITTSSGATSSNVTISSTGSIQSSSTSTPGINKAALWYGISMSSNDVSFTTNHFTFLDMDFGIPASTIQSLKGANPNIKTIGYRGLIGMKDYDSTNYGDWSTVTSHEDWFLHDAYGNR